MLVSVVIAALFLLPPVGFAIVTLVVCMLAAWEWGQLSGFTTRWPQRVWLAVLCGLLLALMLFLLPEYHRNIHQPLVEISLWASLGWSVFVALLLVLFYPGSAAIWRNSKTLRLIFGVLTHCSLLLGHAGVTGLALRRESLQWRNMAALSVMILGMGGADSGVIECWQIFW